MSEHSSKSKDFVLIGNIASMITNFRKELVLDLIRKGYVVYCFAYGYTDKEYNEVKSWGAIPKEHFINPNGMNPLKDMLAVFKLIKELKAIRPEIVLTTFIKPVIFGSIAAKLAKVPKIIGMIEGLGNAFTPYKEGNTKKAKLVKFIQVILYRISLPLLDKLIVLNPDDKKDLVDKYQIPVKETIVLGGIGVDLDKFKYVPANLEQPVSFIFIARLLMAKGIFEYLAAAEIVKKKYPDSRFVVLGSFDDTNPFSLSKDQLDYYINNDIIIYPGYVDNVPEEISKVSVFVLPSYYREGVPRSTQEAMAIGRAIITTDVPGCRETVVDGQNGFLVQPYKPEKLADKMVYFIENKDEIKKMGQRSRELAEEKFNIVNINNKLISILEDE